MKANEPKKKYSQVVAELNSCPKKIQNGAWSRLEIGYPLQRLIGILQSL